MVIKAAPGLHASEMISVEPNVNVDSVSGIEAYETDNGELRGKYTEPIDDDETIALKVVYDRTFDNNVKKQFTCREIVSNANRDISLSKAPWHNIRGNYVTNVSIEVSVYD